MQRYLLRNICFIPFRCSWNKFSQGGLHHIRMGDADIIGIVLHYQPLGNPVRFSITQTYLYWGVARPSQLDRAQKFERDIIQRKRAHVHKHEIRKRAQIAAGAIFTDRNPRCTSLQRRQDAGFCVVSTDRDDAPLTLVGDCAALRPWA